MSELLDGRLKMSLKNEAQIARKKKREHNIERFPVRTGKDDDYFVIVMCGLVLGNTKFFSQN